MMKYEVDIKVIKDGCGYNVYINGLHLDYFGNLSSLLYSNARILSGIVGLGANFSTRQVQQYLIENHLHEPPQAPTKLTVAEIEQKLGIKNLEIIGDDK